MPIYKQRVDFRKEFTITAKNAEEANSKLDELVQRVEWDGEVESEGHYSFEDEPIECPECKGDGGGYDGEDTWINCSKCNGDGQIPFQGQ